MAILFLKESLVTTDNEFKAEVRKKKGMMLMPAGGRQLLLNMQVPASCQHSKESRAAGEPGK